MFWLILILVAVVLLLLVAGRDLIAFVSLQCLKLYDSSLIAGAEIGIFCQRVFFRWQRWRVYRKACHAMRQTSREATKRALNHIRDAYREQ